MEEKTLFEIPIYSMSEKEFNKRRSKKENQLVNKFVTHGWDKERAGQITSTRYYPRWLWRYNQIVGFINISVTTSDVLFDIFCSMDKKYYFDAKKKHFINNWAPNGIHFYAVDKTDTYIKQEIRTWLKSIEKEHLPKKFYIDYSTFNNIFEFVDIKKIMLKL